MYKLFVTSLFITCLGLSGGVAARGVYQEPAEFLEEVFAGKPPKSKVVWLTGERRKVVEAILMHKPDSLRVRYWLAGQRSAWVLEEIGKEKPITVGIVINEDHIERVKVLVFRESRGWEIRHPFFTNQFKQATLTREHRLDKTIDGISGATLSVRSLRKLATLALYLHQQVTSHDTP